jgi:hypothetical protein
MPSGKMDAQSIMGTIRKFVGVYSGRLIEPMHKAVRNRPQLI